MLVEDVLTVSMIQIAAVYLHFTDEIFVFVASI